MKRHTTRPTAGSATAAAALRPERAERTERAERYTITELAREFALTSRAIRFYEDQGLIAPERRGSRRIYSARDRVRLRLILRGKRLGMSLAEIREILDLYEADKTERAQLTRFLEVLAARRAVLEQQREDIAATLAEIGALERECQRRLRSKLT
ncbi:MAG: MerR family transcriptional regulator [Casimicrobiaceae bacterium]